MDRVETQSVINTASIDAVIAARDSLVASIDQCGALFSASRTQIGPHLRYPPRLQLDFGGSTIHVVGFDDEVKDSDRSKWTADIDRLFWRHLFEDSGLQGLMSSRRKEELEKTLGGRATEAVPELTEENVRATFGALFQQAPELFEESVEAVYRALSWEYKTNQPCKFGEKLILEYAAEHWGSRENWSLDYNSKLYDLERAVCRVLGIPQPDKDSGLRTKRNWAFGEWHEGAYEAESAPFSFRGYLNGNVHIRFPDRKATDELNKIMAKRYPGRVAPARKR